MIVAPAATAIVATIMGKMLNCPESGSDPLEVVGCQPLSVTNRVGPICESAVRDSLIKKKRIKSNSRAEIPAAIRVAAASRRSRRDRNKVLLLNQIGDFI